MYSNDECAVSNMVICVCVCCVLNFFYMHTCYFIFNEKLNSNLK